MNSPAPSNETKTWFCNQLVLELVTQTSEDRSSLFASQVLHTPGWQVRIHYVCLM